jgi:putative NADH-flavin reductase
MDWTKVYFITTFKSLDDYRTVGFCSQLKDALRIVETNSCDIFEYDYDYAIIEEVEEGLYPMCQFSILYKWNFENERYEKVENQNLFEGHLFCGIG